MYQVMKVAGDFFLLKICVFSEVELLVCVSIVLSYFFFFGRGGEKEGMSHPIPAKVFQKKKMVSCFLALPYPIS